MKRHYMQFLLIVVILFSSFFPFLPPAFCLLDIAFAQENSTIRDIVVEKNFDVPESLVITQSGLHVGTPLSGDSASQAVHTLWRLGIFSDVRIKKEQLSDGIRVIIEVELLPAVNTIKTEGFKEISEDEALKAIGLVRNQAIGERKIAKMTNQLLDMYRNKGYLLAKVSFDTIHVPSDSTKVDVLIKVAEGKKVKIKDLHIEGNENLSEKKIKKVMKTKEDRWFRSGDFKREDFEQDKSLIVQLYKTMGYRDAVVARDSTFADEKTGKLNLAVFINEGQKYKFGKTTFEGSTKFTENELKEKIKYSEGETFNEDLINQAMYELTVLYNNKGFLKVLIVPSQVAHEDTVDIAVDIAEGNVSKVARIDIEGNTKTIEKVIRREIPLLPGMEFNRELFDRSQRNIMSLNYFEDVKPDYIPHEDSDDVDIIIKVSEKQTGTASMGAGYSELDKLVGTISLSNSNLFGRGQGVNFSWEIGSRRKGTQIGFNEPWLFDTPTSFSCNLYNTTRSDYTTAFDQEDLRGGYVRFGRRLKWPDDYCHAYVSYSLEDVNYINPSSYYQDYLVSGKTSSLSLMFQRDSRDLPEFATKGSRTSATFEVAGGPLRGDMSYYKYLFNNEFYTPIFWQISFVLRSRIGYLKGYKQTTSISYSERFMPGGTSYDGTVRGYSDRQVCPRLDQSEIGGETMLVNNLELQFPIVARMIYGLCFYDFGNAWRNIYETNPFDVKRSAGMGVRLAIPGMGMLGFDFGYGFDKLEGSDRVSGWRTHFQFGNQFY